MNSFQHFTPQPSTDTLTQPLKRTRAKRSCDFCRKRKSRCDADNSIPCTNCKAWGYTCEFQTVRKKRGPPSVYVDNLEKKCKKMESLLSSLTKLSIKDLERNDFQYAGHIRSDSPSLSDSSSGDEDEDDEQEENENYDSIKYTGQSSIGLDFIDDDIFKSQSTIPWPGRQDVVLQPMSQDELMIVSTEKSATGKFDKRVDVGLSMRGPLFNPPAARSPCQKTMKKPARHHLDKMIGLYFTHIHSALPIVNKTRFLSQYHSNLSNPPTILTHAVLAFSFRFASQHLPDLVTHADHYGDFYFRKVMRRLRDISRSRLCHVQAALLMTLYLDNDENDVESIQWCTLGSAIRMAQDLGLHRSCSKWNLPRSEIETRHRVFYACYLLDRWFGARAGKPLTILDRDFDTDMPLPYEVTDDDDGDAPPSQPIYRSFLLAIKLAEILGRVLKALYAPKAKIANSNANLDDPTILAVFDRRLKNWKTSLDEPLDGYYLSGIEKVNLQLYYYTIVLLLNRPFNRASFAKFPNLQSIAEESEQACRYAASKISAIVQQRRREIADPTYYSVLCAPSFFIYALFQSALVHLSSALRNRNSTTKQALYQSINLIKMHWDINPAPRAVEILNMLASINGLSSDEIPSPPQEEVKSVGSIPSPPIPSQYDAGAEQEMPKTQCLERMINTSIIGGITPDIQQDMTSWSMPTYPVYSQSPVHHHPTANFPTPPPYPQFPMSVPIVNYEHVYETTHLPQVPPAFTAYHSNVVRSLPPSSLNWSDWDVYIGHQSPRP